ncbi:MAG: adenylyltransferase/cytidyltransferase family protein [Burkholderiales bacterium]|nr:adenylyltransferase/cytidyltransferase family protein [Burkholderiales bacterium]
MKKKISNKLKTIPWLFLRVLYLKERRGRKIVYTDGVFDTLHPGHVDYIHIAAQKGDILIVGIHSDELTKERKGKDRPLIPFKGRVKIISALQDVDYVVEIKDKKSYYNIIKKLNPDILVLSETTTDKDYSPKAVVKCLNGLIKKITILPAQSEFHTTDLIRKEG